MSNFKKTFQLVAVFLFVSVVQLSAQTYKYQKIVGFSDETNAKLEAFLQSTISMNIRKVAVFDCDGTLFGQVPYLPGRGSSLRVCPQELCRQERCKIS